MEWVATFLTVLGLWLNGNGRSACWPLWIVSNVIWIATMLPQGQGAIVVVNLCLLVVNVRGWWAWSRRDGNRMIADDPTDFAPTPTLPLHPPKAQRLLAPVGPLVDADLHLNTDEIRTSGIVLDRLAAAGVLHPPLTLVVCTERATCALRGTCSCDPWCQLRKP